MTEYYSLLSAAVGDQPNLSRDARLQLYKQARKAMIDRLGAIAPPLSGPEIENETDRFDRAVFRMEREISERGLGSAAHAPMQDEIPQMADERHELAVCPPATPPRDAGPRRRRSRPRAKGTLICDGITAFGVLAIAALCVVRAAHPLPGNLRIRIRWDQLLASPLRAESAPRHATASPGNRGAADTGTSLAALPARLALVMPVFENYHDVDLSHLPRPVRNLLHAGEKRLKNYRLRDVFAEFALVEAPHGVLLVREGGTLESVGRVTSIEQREQRWVVTTTAGVILN
jgi:hypothetical protein